MRVLGDLAKIVVTWLFGDFWSRFFAQNLLQSFSLSAYKLEDNAISARILLGLSNKGYFLDDFWNISLSPPLALFQKMRVLGDLAKYAITWKISLALPFALFQKMRVLGDLAKIAITWPFGHIWSRFLHRNHLHSWHFKCILIRG